MHGGLHLHSSNRFERLAHRLVEALAVPGASPFEAPTVLVPSTAIRRRLTLDAARHHGVCANVRFDYLASWLWAGVVRHFNLPRARSPFEVDPLAWRIHAALSDADWVARHDRLARYVARGDETMRYELARRIAQVLNHYTTYRTTWLEAWQAGGQPPLGDHGPNAREDARWLAALWQRITSELGVTGGNPLAAYTRDLCNPQIESIPGLPDTLHVFGLPAIAPLHLAALEALGRRIRVELYVPAPCREFWSDLVDARRKADLEVRGQADHHEVGHALLAAWGRQAQAQRQLLDALDPASDTADMDSPDGGSLLETLQRSLLELDEPPADSIELAPDDRSLEVHVCHSLTRELEVLHDRLLAMFRDDPGLGPSDVLVVVPDLESAAPLVDAVFGSAPQSRRIPYTLTGLAASRSNDVARVLLDVLALARSRWRASEVHALLSRPLVAERFGLDDASLEQIRGWIAASGIRWGADAGHRASLGLPATDGHSAADGLERLFLGYALPEGALQPFAGRLPAGDPQGQEASALGALWRFIESLRALQAALSGRRSAAHWMQTVEGALHDFIAQDAREPEAYLQVRRSVRRLAQDMPAELAASPLPFELAQQALQQALDASSPGGVPSGAVTFAPMHDLRGVPYPVVCLLGLTDRAFPSLDRPAEFDLMRFDPRAGDRQRRMDDRNTFLDLLLAARRAVHLSYTGRDTRDNAVAPPSVVISELLDWVLPRLRGEPDAVRARLVVEHPLQPFSRRCFGLVPGTDPRVLSFDTEYAQALSAADARRGKVGGDDTPDDAPLSPGPVFFAEPLPPPDPTWHDVPLDRLVRFFANPSRFLLEQRIGLSIERAIPELEDDEPFVADRRAGWTLSDRLLQPCVDGAPADVLRELARAGVEAPRGPIGETWLAGELGRMRTFAAHIRARTAGEALPPHTVRLPIDVDGTVWTLHAHFTTLRPQGLVRWQDGQLRAEHRLAAWLHHLVLSAVPAPGAAANVAWIGRDETLGFAAVEGPRAHLAALMRLYAQGLQAPLMLFPNTAWALVGLGKERDARDAWVGGDFPRHRRGERDDPAYRIVLRGRPDPVETQTPEFLHCAHTVFGPLRDHANPG